MRVLQARQDVELVGGGEQRDGALAGADRTGQDGLDVLAGVELAQFLHDRRVQRAATVQKVGTFNESLNVHRQHGVGIPLRPECQKVSSRLLQEGASGVAGQGRGVLQHRRARQRHPLYDVVGSDSYGLSLARLTSVYSVQELVLGDDFVFLSRQLEGASDQP